MRIGERTLADYVLLALAAMLVASPTGASTTGAPAAKTKPARVIDARQIKRKIAAIDRRREACRGQEPFISTNEKQECDGRAIEAYERLTPRASSSARLTAFYSSMFGLFMFKLTPGDDGFHDALSMRVVIIGTYGDFARRRAEILTGVARASPPTRAARRARGMFDWIDRTPGLADWVSGDKISTTRDAARRWLAIRDADCAAYPVPRCAERLDDAMRAVVKDLTSP